MISLLHSTSLGSGSHFPFLMQIAELAPFSTCPDEQLIVMLVPSIARPLYPIIFTTLLPIRSAGFPHLAKEKTNNKHTSYLYGYLVS